MVAKSKKNGTAGPTYYMLSKQLPEYATLFGMPGDIGLLIDTLKITHMSPHRADQLQRLYGLTPYKGKETFECKCGIKFASEHDRMGHGRRRHAPRTTPVTKDFADLSDEQKARMLAQIDEYETYVNDFNTPDPEDRRIGEQDRALLNSIDWSQTEASQK